MLLGEWLASAARRSGSHLGPQGLVTQ